MTAHPETIQERGRAQPYRGVPGRAFRGIAHDMWASLPLALGMGPVRSSFRYPRLSARTSVYDPDAPHRSCRRLASAITILCFSAPPLRACGWSRPGREALFTRNGLVY